MLYIIYIRDSQPCDILTSYTYTILIHTANQSFYIRLYYVLPDISIASPARFLCQTHFTSSFSLSLSPSLPPTVSLGFSIKHYTAYICLYILPKPILSGPRQIHASIMGLEALSFCTLITQCVNSPKTVEIKTKVPIAVRSFHRLPLH